MGYTSAFVFLINFILKLPLVKCFNSSNLVDTAVFIASTEFNPSRITLVITRSEDYVDLTELLTQYQGSVVIVTVQNDSNDIISDLSSKYRPTQIILLASIPDHFKHIGKILNMNMVVPFRTILLLTEPTTNESQITEVTRAAWKNDIGDIVILTVDADYEDVRLWTYYPYGNGKCGNDTAVLLEKTSMDFFPRKFINFYGCPVRVAILEFLPYINVAKDNDTVLSVSGCDGMFLKFMLDKLNATFNIVSSTDLGGFGTFENGTGTGTFGYLVNRTADIMVPALTLSNERYEVTQISNVYEYLYAYWCGPNRRPLGDWEKFLHPYTYPSLTVLILFNAAVFVASTKVIRRYALCRPDKKRGILFITYAIFLGQEVKQLETKCWLLNGLFALWMWFSMVARIVYQGKLISDANQVLFEPLLGTFDEAVDKVEGFGGEEFAASRYLNYTKGTYKVIDADEIATYLHEIAKGKRFLILINLLLVEWYNLEVQVLDESTSPAPLALHMRPGWPASIEVNAITSQLMEAGFVTKIYSRFDYDKHESYETEDEAKPVSMNSVKGIFLLMAVYCTIPTFVFIYEKMHYKYTLKCLKCK